MSRSRSSCTRTGRPVFSAASATSAAQVLPCVSLPPKPPPMRGDCTITLLPRQVEHVARRPPGSPTDAASTTRRRPRRPRRAPPTRRASRGRSAPARRSRTRPRTAAGSAASAAAQSPRRMHVRLGVEALRRDRVAESEDAAAAARTRPRPGPRRRGRRASDSPTTSATMWPWNETSSVGEQGLVVADAPTSLCPGTSSAISTATTPGSPRRARVAARDPRARVRRAHRPDLEHVAALRDVVDVERARR